MGLGHSPRIVTDGLVLALDAANLKSYDKYENLITNSEDITATGWGKYYNSGGTASDPILTANYGIAPDGTQTADRVQLDKGAGTTTNDNTNIYNDSYSTVAGQPYTQSVWLKTTDGSTKYVRFSFSGLDAEIKTVTGTWQRFVNKTASAADTLRNFRLSLRGSFGTSDSADLLVWGAQVERGTTVTDYYKTTGTAKTRGTTWTDLSGKGNTGTLTNGPTYSSDNGGSLVFDGSDDYIDCGNPSLSSGKITVNAWIKINTGSINQHIVDSASNSWHLAILSANKPYFWNGSTFHTTAPALTVGQWYMLTGVQGTTLDIYINGVLGQSIATNVNVSTNNVNIGRWQSASRPYDGNIAQVSIYNKALTASEIQQNFNALRGRFGI